MKTICEDHQSQTSNLAASDRSFKPVAAGVHKVMESKTLDELEKLEKQINTKLSSNEAIDTDYWEHTLKTLLTYKARARLRKVSQAVAESRSGSGKAEKSDSNEEPTAKDSASQAEPPAKRAKIDHSEPIQPAMTQFDREVARGLGENEELFMQEEEVTTKNLAKWSGQHRPRKPKYFNRVQLGYEWNKYNQTHYDHDNPPPKVVQGYKFNIFYPELVNPTATPTYRLERSDGRRRGETTTPAGENDTCLIRFVAGPPYEDIAFRIVDKDWDHSAKRERGFRSTFDRVCGKRACPKRQHLSVARLTQRNRVSSSSISNSKRFVSGATFQFHESCLLMITMMNLDFLPEVNKHPVVRCHAGDLRDRQNHAAATNCKNSK
jgi:hypothetical protein